MKFCIIGLGNFGTKLARELTRGGAEVLAVDLKEEAVNRVKDEISYAVILNSMDPSALHQLPLKEMDAVIVAIGEDFQSSILTTAYLQEMGLNNIICRVINSIHERILRQMNVPKLILPEQLAAMRISTSLLLSGVIDSYALSADYDIIELPLPTQFIGQNLQSIGLRPRYNLTLITIKRSLQPNTSPEVLGIINPDFIFAAHDIMVVFGSRESVRLLLSEAN